MERRQWLKAQPPLASSSFWNNLAQITQYPIPEKWDEYNSSQVVGRFILQQPNQTSRPLKRSRSEFQVVNRVPIDLSRPQVVLPKQASAFRYGLVNNSDQALVAPVLFQTLNWSSAKNLLESSGILNIKDELQRAKALWELVYQWSYHLAPLTGFAEEEDPIKFLALYGYGFCDDAAVVLGQLANLAGLRGRVWGLSGHVVPEIFANGKWRLFDPDHRIYFLKEGKGFDVLGVEDLSKSPQAFSQFRSEKPLSKYPYQSLYLSTEDNSVNEKLPSSYNHQIEIKLLPKEEIRWANFNWGSRFVGFSPKVVPEFYNGYFEYPFAARDFGAEFASSRNSEKSWELRNDSSETKSISFSFRSPFPIVSAEILGFLSEVKGTASISTTYKGATDVHCKKKLEKGKIADFMEPCVPVVAKNPIYDIDVVFTMEGNSSLRFEEAPRLIREFQFARLALLKLKPGLNKFETYWPEPSDKKGLIRGFVELGEKGFSGVNPTRPL